MYAGKALRFTRVGKETGIAHPCKTRRENMLKETKDKLYSRNRDFFRLACFPVCNSNGYGGAVIADDSAVGYGCFEGITGKIINGVAIAIEGLHDLSNPVHIVELVAKRVPQRQVKVLLLVRRRYPKHYMIISKVRIGLVAGAEEAGEGVSHENLRVMDDKRNERWYTRLRNMKAGIIWEKGPRSVTTSDM